MKKSILFFLVLTLFFTSVLNAHDVWVGKEKDGLVVIWGHGEERYPYKPEYVKEVKAYDASGKEMGVTVTTRDSKAYLATAKPPAVVDIVFNSGAWVKTTEGWKNLSKREVKDSLQSLRIKSRSKNLWQWNDRFSKPLGDKMEVVPLKNPLALKVGDKFSFQALYNGKPLSGATVWAEGIKRGSLKTDPNGRAEVVIKKSGLNKVCAVLKTKSPNDPDADVLSQTANITFEVK